MLRHISRPDQLANRIHTDVLLVLPVVRTAHDLLHFLLPFTLPQKFFLHQRDQWMGAAGLLVNREDIRFHDVHSFLRRIFHKNASFPSKCRIFRNSIFSGAVTPEIWGTSARNRGFLTLCECESGKRRQPCHPAKAPESYCFLPKSRSAVAGRCELCGVRRRALFLLSF